MKRDIHGIEVAGLDLDSETRCGHYAGPHDIIALKFKCCGDWYPCIHCHRALAGHDVVLWPVAERDQRAVLCGVCGHRLRIADYLDCASVCPCCTAVFNSGCALHHPLYFEMKSPV